MPYLGVVIAFQNLTNLKSIQSGGQKGPSTSFSPVTSTNVGISPQNFLTFSFNPFVTRVWNFKAIPSASPKLLNLNQEHPSKKWYFWLNHYKIKVMLTCTSVNLYLRHNLGCKKKNKLFDVTKFILVLPAFRLIQ